MRQNNIQIIQEFCNTQTTIHHLVQIRGDCSQSGELHGLFLVHGSLYSDVAWIQTNFVPECQNDLVTKILISKMQCTLWPQM